MLSRLSAFVVWALVAATVVFWGLRLSVRAPGAPPYAVAVGEGTALRGDLSRLLGTAPVAVVAAAPEAASRFRLLGVVAPKDAGAGGTSGVALIAVDGKLPKAFRVGSNVDGDLVLQSVSLRSASIATSHNAPAVTLDLPPPVPAATGTLPTGSGVGPGGGVLPTLGPVPVPQFQPAPSGLPMGGVPARPEALPLAQ